MQYDARTAAALAALAAPREQFRSALIAAIEEITALLVASRAPAEQRALHEAERLGPFAAARIDAARFSDLVTVRSGLAAGQLDQLDRALRILRGFAAQDDQLFVLRVARGADLRDSVRDALAERGRAFNAAHHAELLSTGRSGLEVEPECGSLEFRHWTRRERMIAPPLVVEVSGSDARPASLADYLDGAQKIVLIVDGRCSPAPLARLVAPATFVMQTTDVAAVARLASYSGPGIAAVCDAAAGAACFVHDPGRGAGLGRRLEVTAVPPAVRGRVPGVSGERQAEELAWLEELRALAAAAAAAVPQEDAPAASPADQLAAWLLRHADPAPAE